MIPINTVPYQDKKNNKHLNVPVMQKFPKQKHLYSCRETPTSRF